MNGVDNPLVLVEDILNRMRPWTTVLDYAFYIGVAYGTIKCMQLSKEVISGLTTYFLSSNRLFGSRDFRELYGKWAVVTGATSAVGVAFAYEFASRGLNVVLISRSYDKLLPIVSTIQTEYNVQAYGLHADFFLGQHVFTEIEEALLADKLDIGILVNTNPIHYDYPQYFSQVPPSRLWQLVNVNIAATTMMTHVVLPRMLRRGRGAVINLSTCLCCSVCPLQSGSLASKVYVEYLGRSLHEECRHKGIIVQTLTPWKLSPDSSSASFFAPSPEIYVRSALQTLGASSRCCGYWPHGIISFLYMCIPSALWIWLVGHRNRMQRQKCLVQNMNCDPTHLFARKPRRISNVAVHSVKPSSYPPSPTSVHPPPPPRPAVSDGVMSSAMKNRLTVHNDHSFKPTTLQRTYSRVMVVPSVAAMAEKQNQQ